jgi:hypothetical protein
VIHHEWIQEMVTTGDLEELINREAGVPRRVGG